MRRALSLVVLTLLLAVSASAQSTDATLTGRVLDPSNAAIVGARVEAINVQTNIRRSVETNEEGIYVVPNLKSGIYRIEISKPGFKSVIKPDVTLRVQDVIAINFTLPLGSVTESITVTAGAPLVNTQSGAVGTVVDRHFMETVPLDGRSFHSLIALTPGVVLTETSSLEQGQFSISGQRANANYFTVDGVSANVGVVSGTGLGQSGAGSLPGLTAFGGTSNLASVDSVQEFRVQTSTYSAEFGRMPGGQISIATRSGTNQFHGSVFNYFRNDKLDANNWFANRAGLPRPPLRQNDFGGVLGGPLAKDRTFFFFSYEGLRLRQPQTRTAAVPTMDARNAAPSGIQEILTAYPVPNGPDLGNNLAQLSAVYSDPSSLNTTGIRLDHYIGNRLTLFGRYVHAPSSSRLRGGALSFSNVLEMKTQSLTLGTTYVATPTIVGDFRLNWTRFVNNNSNATDEFGGAVPPPESLLFPPAQSRGDTGFILSIVGAPIWQDGKNAFNLQRQVNVVNNLSVARGSHSLKVGIDYRKMFPRFSPLTQTIFPQFSNVDRALTGITTNVLVIDWLTGDTFPRFSNLSLFAQDTWSVARRLTLTLGMRWEYNPPPTEKNGNVPFTVFGLDDPATIRLAPRGTPLWKTTHNNFAPRVGIAYQVSERGGPVIRGGFGIFYDTGTGPIAEGMANAFPNASFRALGPVPFPIDPALLVPVPKSLEPPFRTAFDRFFVAVPNLKLPYTTQWSVALEQPIGVNHGITVTYVGSAGRRLLRQERLQNPNPDFLQILVQTNAATSDYHALQLQFVRRLTSGLQILASHSWAHSIDTASNDSFSNAPEPVLDIRQERASSNFDIRHSFSAAVRYDLPTPRWGDVVRVALGNWSTDMIVRAQSARTINIITGTDILGVGLSGTASVTRPNVVEGVPVWIHDPSVPMQRRINRAVFSVPPTGQQGNLGRNALRGFGFWQVDSAIRRHFNVTERVSVRFGAEFFNLFNHPNFGNPIGRMNDPMFGESTRMLGASLGAGGLSGGFTPLYQVGGSRSVQLLLRVHF